MILGFNALDEGASPPSAQTRRYQGTLLNYSADGTRIEAKWRTLHPDVDDSHLLRGEEYVREFDSSVKSLLRRLQHQDGK